MSGRHPGKTGLPPMPLLREWLSRRAAVGEETTLFMRPAVGELTELWEPTTTGARGFMKCGELPRYWKKWLRGSCSSREVITEGL